MRCSILFAILIGIMAAARIAPAAKIRVPVLYKIQAGIDAASDGDTVLVANGRYSGPGNRDIDFRGKSIVVISENGADATIVDAAGHVGFIFSGGEDAFTVLSGFTITDGDPGISCAKASPRITGNIIRDNERGMYIYDDSDPVIEDNLIEQNGDLSYAEASRSGNSMQAFKRADPRKCDKG
jgi:parallel beta-helix repeat protein